MWRRDNSGERGEAETREAAVGGSGQETAAAWGPVAIGVLKSDSVRYFLRVRCESKRGVAMREWHQGLGLEWLGGGVIFLNWREDSKRSSCGGIRCFRNGYLGLGIRLQVLASCTRYRKCQPSSNSNRTRMCLGHLNNSKSYSDIVSYSDVKDGCGSNYFLKCMTRQYISTLVLNIV